jgi:putative DNA primase/helicase
MTADPFAPLRAGGQAPKGKVQEWIPILPIPADAPPLPRHPELGTPSAVYSYRDGNGAVLGYVLRFDPPSGKDFRPCTFCHHPNGTLAEWRWQGWKDKRPIYNQDKIESRPSAPILICEGEKAADAAAALAPGFVTTTSPGGAKAGSKADWRLLQGRTVVIWPDADAPGATYAKVVARHAAAVGALDIKVIAPPPLQPEGWDAANALAEGWDEAQTRRLISTAKSPENKPPPQTDACGDDGERRRVPQRDILITCADDCEFWHDADSEAFVTFPKNGHVEHWKVRSKFFKLFLCGRLLGKTRGAAGSQAIEDALRVFEARAINEGAEYTPCIRVGRHKDRLYIDLCDARWRVVEITSQGWNVIDSAPIKMMRSKSMRPLPDPEGGSLIEELSSFFNMSDGDYTLTVAWIITAFRERGPYPILIIGGEQGSGKSTVAQMIRSLVDPSRAPIRSASKDERDLFISASNSWVLAFDNLSGIPPWLSDALSTVATKGGLATKLLYTDTEEMIFEAQRPIVLNGIPFLAERPDLAERAIIVRCKTISSADRIPEDELWQRFDDAHPRIFGAICDALSTALRRYPKVRRATHPRMADMMKWVTAAAPGLGWDDGQLDKAYDEKMRDTAELAFEADNVAGAIRKFMNQQRRGWEGTAAELLIEINKLVTEAEQHAKTWPKAPSAFSNRLERIAPLLRGQGLVIERRRANGARIITIVRTDTP